jgi:hypothetical protein
VARNQQVSRSIGAAHRDATRAPAARLFLFNSFFRSAIDSIQIDSDLGAFVASLTAVSVLKSEPLQVEAP